MTKPTLPTTERHRALSDEINEATKKPHTNLNRLITARLPLALPPHATTPVLYGRGLLHFAYIYLTFETLWLSLLHSTPATTPTLELVSHSEFPLRDLDPVRHVQTPPKPDGDYRGRRASVSRRVQTFLEHLLLPGLMRGERLKEDLGYLTGLSAAELGSRLEHPEGKRTVEFVAHIRSAILDKPHVLISYAWVMYMAIFSGGRWMREQMLLAGTEFWSEPGARAKVSMSGRKARDTIGIEFFHFKGSEDGEDIRQEFKRRFAELDQLLTPNERQDIVSEAVRIFHFHTLMVEELDGMFGQRASSGEPSSLNTAPSSAIPNRPRAKQTTEKSPSSDSRIRGSKSLVARLMDGNPPPKRQPNAIIATLATLVAIFGICLWFLLS
ncbi:MAG: heme oxygenase [Trichoglossum hirsutum]|nr:MAG: heme oxygenase [Trichoglossum hirsutum]